MTPRKKFGHAFGDLIETARFKRTRFGVDKIVFAQNWDRKEKKEFTNKLSPWRLMIIYVGFVSLFLVLITRVIDLQIIKGQEFLNKAEGNRIKLFVEHAPRGVIYDRSGKILAQNIPGARLEYEPSFLPEGKKKLLIDKLSSILDLTKGTLEEKVNSAKDQPVTIVESLPIEKIPLIEAEADNLPNINLEIRPIRHYPFKEVTAHLLGYTLEADEADLRKDVTIPYSLGDQVGKAGVEQSSETTFRGVNGYRLVSITASGEKRGEVYESKAIEGSDITLSIDIDLQRYTFDLVKKAINKAGAKSGSALVLNPNTGEILALVSIPSFDNNLFAKGIDKSTYNRLISNPYRPLINRAIGAAHPPGSTFKLISSAAGLESGAITPGTKITDPGYITLGGQTFRNWLWNDQRRTEGSIDVVRAIARSTDTFFYLLGQKMGERQLEKYAREFGLGTSTGIGLPGEIPGLVPSNEWKLEVKGEPWYPGETLNMSIGQGDLLATPLQMALVSAVFANGGKLVRPTLLKTEVSQVVKEGFLKDETIKTVKEGMYQNTVGDGNVGWLFSGTKYKSAGKTGTAESGQERPHAWYIGYAPHPKGEIAVAVMVENGGHGSEVCAPVVKEIFNWWFRSGN